MDIAGRPWLRLSEEALYLLFVARSAADRARDLGLSSCISGRPESRESILIQSSYFRQVSVVEAFVDSASRDLFAFYARGTNDEVRAALADVGVRGSNSWDTRKEVFSQYHGIRLTSLDRWQEFWTAVKIRNTIAHGLGTLTSRQRLRKIRKEIGLSGIRLFGDAIVISAENVDACYEVCRSIVLGIDALIANDPKRANYQSMEWLD